MLHESTYIVEGERDVSLLLDHGVEQTVDDAKGVEVNVLRTLHFGRAVANLLVLLLEEAHEARPVVPAVALRPQADAVVVGLVVRELEEEGLRKVPQRMRRQRRRVGRIEQLLAGERAVAAGGLRDGRRAGRRADPL